MLGFHISITSKKLLNSIKVVYEEYSNVGANAFQVFLKNPKSYRVSNIPQKQIELARDYIKENEIIFVSHGTYLLHPWKFKMEQKIPKKNFQGLFVSERVNFDFDMSSNIPDLLLLHK